MRFAVVTPCFNPGHYLLETLASVLGQRGNFSLAYHVQDACSTDGSTALIAEHLKQLGNGNLPFYCRELSFSYAFEPDLGMYDAINRGFLSLSRRTEADAMLWVNADDLLEPDALARLQDYFLEHPDVDWVTGRILHLDQHGKSLFDEPPHRFLPEDLAAGRHNGRTLPFVTQEATAWRTRMWQACGPLDASLRYAGDFEYWMRAARQGFSLHGTSLRLGCHRKRPGQLSAHCCYAEELALIQHRTIR
ncbi:glycosyltransferase [Solidesulfovibrio sp.]